MTKYNFDTHMGQNNVPYAYGPIYANGTEHAYRDTYDLKTTYGRIWIFLSHNNLQVYWFIFVKWQSNKVQC